MSDPNHERPVSRRSVLRKGAVTSATLAAGVVGTSAGALGAPPGGVPPANTPPEFDPEDVTGTIVVDAPEPTFRIDNRNATAAKVQVESTGATDGNVYTVGAHQASFDPPTGKYIAVECGEVITGLLARRPQDDVFEDSGFTGTATAPSCTDS